MGYFKIDRSLFDHYLWDDKPFSKGQAWIDLIGLANFEDGKAIYRNKLVVCKRGTVNRSISFLANRWGWGREKTRNFLKLLESDNMISIEATTRRTTLTLVNYGKFQDVPTTDRPTNRQQTDQQTDNRPDKEKRRIKKNKEGEEIYGTANPPTLEEVRDYCRSRGSVVNPEAFVAYYSAREWTLSRGQPMKDWKAQVRYWEQNERKGANNEPVNPRQGEHYEDVYNQIFGDDD